MPTLAYYVVQACALPRHLPRLVWLYAGFSGVGLLYAGLSFWVRHPYITWVLVGVLAIAMGFTLLLLVGLYLRGVRPAIWNVLALLTLLPFYAYFYGRNAGFFTGSIQEESLRFLMLISTVAEPFFVVAMLRQATHERIRTADRLGQEKTQRENVEALDKLKTDFFTNVSHELRTPVTLLLGPLQTLHSRFPDNELYALMHRNAGRLQTLINQLLDLAKLDAKQMQNVPTPGNLAADLRTWTAQFDRLAATQSVQLTIHQNQTDWPARYDADKVEKILTNVVGNAVKYTPAGGSVAVDVLYGSTGTTIEVRDTGVGIDPQLLPHLFERFYRGDSDNRQTVGTGVGLALTHELVQLLGGTITVYSQPGDGSTFRITLPILACPTQSTPELDGNAQSQSAGLAPVDWEQIEADRVVDSRPGGDETTAPPRKPLLLLVEDNDDLRAYIRLVLAPQYTLLEATDGQQGLEMAFDALPELIVTDLMMPRLDGLDLCRALRADPRTDYIPLVMLTAKSTIEDRLTGLETGADDYLTKPFLPAELQLRLQNLFRRQAAQQAYWQRTFASPLAEPEQTGEAKAAGHAPTETPVFLVTLYAILEQHLDQPDFDIDQLADALALTSRTLNRKLRGLLNMTTRDVIRNYRLRRGNELIEQGILPTQAAYAVGFGSLSSFGRAYKDQYGHAPSTQKR